MIFFNFLSEQSMNDFYGHITNQLWMVLTWSNVGKRCLTRRNSKHLDLANWQRIIVLHDFNTIPDSVFTGNWVNRFAFLVHHLSTEHIPDVNLKQLNIYSSTASQNNRYSNLELISWLPVMHGWVRKIFVDIFYAWISDRRISRLPFHLSKWFTSAPSIFKGSLSVL